MMKQYQLTMPRFVYSGENSLEKLTDIIARERAKKIIVFTDKGILETGICQKIFGIIGNSGVSYDIISDLHPEPGTADVERVVKQVKESNGELVVAVGGGSVMDMAKLCASMKEASYTIHDLLEDNSLLEAGLPTVMVPTTCGTGSESTFNSIVAVEEKQLKVGIVNINMLADYVILDSSMIAGLPKSIIASTGVDALAHAVECFTSNKANCFSDLVAKESAKLIFENLVKAYNEPSNMEAKTNMLMAAFLAGVAIASSGTTAVHALSYPLGGQYHIPHGISNAILLAPVMRYNMTACQERLATLADIVNPEGIRRSNREKAEEIVKRIEDIVKETNIPTSLSQYNVGKKDLDLLVESAFQVKRLLDNNRKELTKEDIKNIYLEIL
ncbi:Alcohol dehydrogenase, class IV [Anaerovirgula multivorans]|uniref:Alcohol dehydrogenase, class IV n=1 Tax=Anaerovirgula multivorans TaxID=312168 RepID=A0A239BAT6_9FIRM|nr:iron-containing alcohol dehydrogenase [Anaerovirgula multivorans]SNS04558.1 Alcohol dehydrogenase, class IV [Anaerovirgula multivorans]